MAFQARAALQNLAVRPLRRENSSNDGRSGFEGYLGNVGLSRDYGIIFSWDLFIQQICVEVAMDSEAQGLAALLITGWGVLFGVSLGWAIYNLLDQYPRLTAWGTVWSGSFRTMVPGWILTMLLVSGSLFALVTGALHFPESSWSLKDSEFPVIFSLIGLCAFVIPVFINRSVFGFAILISPSDFCAMIETVEKRRMWQNRFKDETARILYSSPKMVGGIVFGESLCIVCFLCWAISGSYSAAGWIFWPLLALFAALFLHLPYENWIKVDEDNLPTTLKPTFLK